MSRPSNKVDGRVCEKVVEEDFVAKLIARVLAVFVALGKTYSILLTEGGTRHPC